MKRNSVSARRSRVLDLFFLVATALVLIAGMMAAQVEWGSEAFLRWGEFAGISAILIWHLHQFSRPRPKPRFGYFFAGFVLAHTIVWCAILALTPIWRVPWFALMFIEVPAYLALYSRVCGRMPRPA